VVEPTVSHGDTLISSKRPGEDQRPARINGVIRATKLQVWFLAKHVVDVPLVRSVT
jgi:hypothetical protein